MKNTKKYLSTGVVLAIALFAAVQISAMAPTVNPYLNAGQKSWLENRIKLEVRYLDPKSAYYSMGSEQIRSHCRETIRRLEEVYYGNRPYADYEIINLAE